MDEHGHEPYAAPDVDGERSGERQIVLLPLLVIVLLVAAVLGGAVALGGDGPPDDPVALLSSAPDAVEEAGSARMSLSMSISMTEGGGELGSMLGALGDIGGDGVIDFRTGESAFEMTMMGVSMEMRAVDGVFYTRMPDMFGFAAGGDAEWIGVPLGEMGVPSGVPFPSTPDASAFVDALRGVSDEITELGNDEINGVDAYGYRTTIDLDKAMALMPEEDRLEATIALGQARAAGMDDMPMEIWITSDGLPVRMIMSTGAAGLDVEIQFDFTDFGIDVDVEPPPADDVQLFDSLAELEETFGPGAGRELEYAS